MSRRQGLAVDAPPPEADTGQTAPTPRLVDGRRAAAYLGVSYWTLRDWVAAGLLEPVWLPALRPREGDRARARLRRLLFDVRDLDAFVDALKGSR